MNYEVEINKINARLDNLQQSFIQAQKNQAPITAKTDNTANQVNVLTPYTESKTVYIDDTECIFDKAKDGNISAWITTDNGQEPCDFEVIGNKIHVTFKPVEIVSTVYISIQ